MDVAFESQGTLYRLSEQAARAIEQRLRQYADGRIALVGGDRELMDVALAVADAIDQAAVGVRLEAIPLQGPISEVVYQAARMSVFEAVDHLAAARLLEALYLQRTQV